MARNSQCRVADWQERRQLEPPRKGRQLRCIRLISISYVSQTSGNAHLDLPAGFTSLSLLRVIHSIRPRYTTRALYLSAGTLIRQLDSLCRYTHIAGQIRVKTNSVIPCRPSTSLLENMNALVNDRPVSSPTYSVPPKNRTATMERGIRAAGVPSLPKSASFFDPAFY